MARYSTVLTHQTLILLEIISIGLACVSLYLFCVYIVDL